jgi:hypothetical protein
MIPTERTLDEVKRTHPAVLAELRKRGTSLSPRMARLRLCNTNRPSGPSNIQSSTRSQTHRAAVNSVVGPLEFTDDVASREADGVLQLRVPLKRRAGPDGAVFEVPISTAQNPFNQGKRLDPEFLKYSRDHQTRVGELSAHRHFVGSQDGKLYAYVEAKGDSIPEGTAEIRVCDAQGQKLAAKIRSSRKTQVPQRGVAPKRRWHTEVADLVLKSPHAGRLGTTTRCPERPHGANRHACSHWPV